MRIALALGLVAALAVVALAANWLFKQRSPDEISAARERLQQIRKTTPPK